jgi:predicted small lipoprotein YifL
MRWLLLVLALPALLGACGKQGALEPRAGRAPPQRAETAVRAPTPQEMLRLDSQAVPARVDDQTGPLPERGDDPFNLPPPRDGAPDDAGMD